MQQDSIGVEVFWHHFPLDQKLVIEEFPDMAHGWTVGGDLSDPNIARDVERAKKLALDFLNRYL